MSDLRLSFRFLKQRPLFAAVAILSVAIGLGSSTAVFSVVNAALLRAPAGVVQPDRVVELGRTQGGRGFDTFSYPELLALRERATPLAEVAGWTWRPMSLSTGGEGVRVQALVASYNYFAVMGVAPHLGRFIAQDEDTDPGSHAVVVLSYRFWQERMGGDPAAVGRDIELNRRAFTVVGVAPADFRGHLLGAGADVYIPLTMITVAVPGFGGFDNRFSSWFMSVGRLADGASIEQANAAVHTTLSALEQVSDDPRNLRSGRVLQLGPVPGAGRMPITAFLGMIAGVVALILLITCANVAGMLIARATARQREMAIRLALGAKRRVITRQLLVESLVLFVLGGVAGGMLAWWGTSMLSTIRLPVPIQLDFDFRPDLRVLGFGLLLSLLTGVLFGLAPALQSTAQGVMHVLKNDAARSGSRGSRLRRAFVAGQVAMSVILLVCSGLFLRSLQRAAGIHTGFNAENTWIVSLNLAIDGYNAERGLVFADQVLARLRALPDVREAAFATDLPLDLSISESAAYVEDDRAVDASLREVGSAITNVSDGYFGALGIAVRRGRVFEPADRDGSPRVAVVNLAFAQAVWPGQEVVGQRFRWGSETADWVTIIGVVDDVKNQLLSEQVQPAVYLPVAQFYDPGLTLIVKTTGGAPAAAVDAIRQVDPKLSFVMPQSLEEYTAIGLLPQRVGASVTTAVGLLALLLSALGVYGVIAYTVAQRTREIGVRMALGARQGDVLRLVVRGGFALVLPGLAIGLVAAFALSRLLRSFILGVAPGDPVTFLVMPAVLLLAVLLATIGPARNASAIQPIRALRSD
jgi:predicted permease